MGDPGVPVMLGLLAIPVCVLLFVMALALMGGRWTSPAPLTELEPAEGPASFEDPWRLEQPRPFEQPRSYEQPRPYEQPRRYEEARPYQEPQGYAEPRPSQDRALPAPRPRRALPSARPQYGAFSHDQHERPAEPDPDPSSPQGFPYGPYRYE